MQCVNEDKFPRVPKAAVRKDLCDGCGLCVDICPAGCLEVIVNPQRPSNRIVFVTSEACHGCGACQGTCPKEAIFIPGLSTADLRRFIKEAITASAYFGEKHK